MQVVEFAPCMSPAGGFQDRAALVEHIEAGVSIGLKHALEVGQVGLRVNALAVDLQVFYVVSPKVGFWCWLAVSHAWH